MGGEVLFGIKKGGVARWGVGPKGRALLAAHPRILRASPVAMDLLFGSGNGDGRGPWLEEGQWALAPYDYGIVAVDCDARRVDSRQGYCGEAKAGAAAASDLAAMADGGRLPWWEDGPTALASARAGWLKSQDGRSFAVESRSDAKGAEELLSQIKERCEVEGGSARWRC